jgi:hypothetical protein
MPVVCVIVVLPSPSSPSPSEYKRGMNTWLL